MPTVKPAPTLPPHPSPRPERKDPIPEEVVLDAQLGDDYSAQRVVLAYRPMIYQVTSSYARALGEDKLQELRQQCTFAIYRAISEWDPDKHGKFAGFAKNTIKQEVRFYADTLLGRTRAVKTKRTTHKMVYLDAPLGEGEESRGMDLPSSAPSPEATLIQKEVETHGLDVKSQIMRYVERMPGNLGRVMRKRFIHKMEPEEIAQQEGKHENTIKSWLKDGVARMVRDLGSELDWLDPESWKAAHEPAPGGSARRPSAD